MPAKHMPGHLIRRLHQISVQTFQSHARDAGFDITPVQFAAMDALYEAPGKDQATLAAAIAYDRATIGGVVDRLEAKGLIERTISPQDRRARVLHLTPLGEATYAALLPMVDRVQDDIVRVLDEEDRGHFIRMMSRLTERQTPPAGED